jgi:ribosomal protein L1
MDLKTFVSESLTQIIQGVEEAQKANHTSAINTSFSSPNTNEKETHIEFDIAVTLEKGTESKAGIAVFGGAINLGTQGKSNKSDVTVSRIRFVVPVAFRLKQNRPSTIF